MGFEQYHEPANELSQTVRTFARMIVSLTEEAEAINWYEQRISVEKDKDAKKIMEHAQSEEFIHFAMDLEFLLRKMEETLVVRGKRLGSERPECIGEIQPSLLDKVSLLLQVFFGRFQASPFGHPRHLNFSRFLPRRLGLTLCPLQLLPGFLGQHH